ncbi:aldo/keto reductase [Streptosporangium pseudovulgare]|uniref:Oxidoreductase n=1 Tax=Streptosporangium pseudovulgare TaxID=35765 RepID=A0ABQ2QY72_9ACTN|nr:aldo/keto reductase [Streptosporangium pseudovulgare]GGQ00323.1 oxidoreductase [Streptosporangium pseudovulgare]
MTMNQPSATAAGDFPLGGDLRVNRLGFGAMRLALGGRIRDPEEGVAVLRRAVELGVNHIDTAGFYGFGDLQAHEMIRRGLSPYSDDLVIATKVGPLLEGGVVPTGQATAGQLRGLVEEDLRRLGRDHLDLVYLRVGGMGRPGGEAVPMAALRAAARDASEPAPSLLAPVAALPALVSPGADAPLAVAERFAALAELRDQGLIRHLGVSNVDAAQLAEARAIAPVAAVQNHFHVAHRDDAAVLAQCEEDGIAYVPFFPLGGGREPIDRPGVANVAARHGATPAQIALAWLLAASPVVLAIPGSSSPDHVAENVAAAGLRLTADDLAELAG